MKTGNPVLEAVLIGPALIGGVVLILSGLGHHVDADGRLIGGAILVGSALIAAMCRPNGK